MSLPLRRYTAKPLVIPRKRQPKLYHLFFNVDDNRILVTDPGWQTHAVGTIEIFFNVADITTARALWNYFESWNDYVYIYISTAGAVTIRFVVGGTSTVYTIAPNGSVSPGRYYALAVVQDGTNLYGYLNGRLTWTNVGVTSWFNTPALTATSDLEIGLIQTYGDFAGYIALVRYYSRPLSLAEIQRNIVELLNPDRTNLEMYLEMEEGQGGTVYDRSGNSKDGAVTGAVWDRLRKWEVRAQII